MNCLKAIPCAESEPCPRIAGRERIGDEYGGFLTDESRTAAAGVDILFFPETIEHVSAALQECARKNIGVSIAGARTGIAGGAVPITSQAVISMEKFNRVNTVYYDTQRDMFFANVDAGVTLSDFQDALRNTAPRHFPWPDESARATGTARLEAAGRRLFYPVDPTEMSAQVGGTIATNASGARTFYYGATRAWVAGVTVVLSTGDILELKRGQVTADDGRFVLETSTGKTVIEFPTLAMPATKHTAGYPFKPDMDAVDLFVGSEGTLGVIVRADLKLTLEPAERLFLTAFPPSESDALAFVDALRSHDGLSVLAIEYFGPHALNLLRDKRREQGASSGVPPIDETAACAVYTEIAFDGDAECRQCYDTITQLLDHCGTSPDRVWAGFSPAESAKMKLFRHAMPEQVNTIISQRKRHEPSLHKVGTDMAVPDESLRDVFSLYRGELDAAGLEYVIFGHVGNNHLHVNILPRDAVELKEAKRLYEHFAREVVKMDGSVSAEHGIGRIKKSFLVIQYGEENVARMRDVKMRLDPAGILNRGVLFD